MCFGTTTKTPNRDIWLQNPLSRSRNKRHPPLPAHADDPIQNSTGDPGCGGTPLPRTPVAAGHDDPADVLSPGPGKAGSFPGTSPLLLSLSLCPSSVDGEYYLSLCYLISISGSFLMMPKYCGVLDGGKSCVVEKCAEVYI
ncbi:hypothetical protein CEXT_66891 [Caerostris extrusa]|uniref:Uncharacterized protein n=1 Tax=Caerostris extrusa TaxID=172846 RepID=A0AAV4SXF9_CAEEX|nr:hypothetical protein CEXT_66891 [Caerostris extrusa]